MKQAGMEQGSVPRLFYLLYTYRKLTESEKIIDAAEKGVYYLIYLFLANSK